MFKVGQKVVALTTDMAATQPRRKGQIFTILSTRRAPCCGTLELLLSNVKENVYLVKCSCGKGYKGDGNCWTRADHYAPLEEDPWAKEVLEKAVKEAQKSLVVTE